MSKKPDTQTDEQQNEPLRWQPTNRQVFWVIGVGAALVAIVLLVVNLDAVQWEGLSRERKEQVALLTGLAVAMTTLIVLLAVGGASRGWTGFGEKKLWDWLQLFSALAIPFVLAVAGFWFTAQQEEHQRQVEDRRAESEQAIEEQRADDAALQAYLDQMSTLLLENDLRFSTEEDATEDSKEARTLARARTLTVLGRLDPSRRTQVLQFLVEAGLVQREEESNPIVSLKGANLNGAVLPFADLRGAELRHANLRDADLGLADLPGADLGSADLRDADLISADLRHANLRYADLNGADLPAADLRYAKLSAVDLRHADLSFANLSITNEELEQRASSLEGATMPDGQKYEDWLKSKGSGEDGENGGNS